MFRIIGINSVMGWLQMLNMLFSKTEFSSFLLMSIVVWSFMFAVMSQIQWKEQLVSMLT